MMHGDVSKHLGQIIKQSLAYAPVYKPDFLNPPAANTKCTQRVCILLFCLSTTHTLELKSPTLRSALLTNNKPQNRECTPHLI